ncbi:L-aspartate oxidase [Aureivirga sp. CE67]|uniref:L-aspartate oxidase n=1 Tax=Aureivirga sp. CE67 TaxID=1788983 RepID=UPI0018CAC62D|nr:L-aspartate oxidase [Aureivirga sp. CE67]
MNCDVLVIGSGIAGLSFAIKMAENSPEKKVVIVTKSTKEESNTKYAQGGIAIVQNFEKDSLEKHIEDTMIAGDYASDREVVKMVVEEGIDRLKDLLAWNVAFDKNKQGNIDLGREGGHSEYRVLHHKDQTGFEIEKKLLWKLESLENVKILSHHFAVDLITEHQLLGDLYEKIRCFGAYILDKKSEEIISIHANATILASGGIGKVFGHTTNPSVATGDGIGMAYRAKASISDMEFVQFHPTALYEKKDGNAFLISEAVRGFGAFLRNKKGERFMKKYDARLELASRDIVSQSIEKEIKLTKGECVYLDCTHLEMDAFKNHFPTIYEKCLSIGVNIEKDWIPVVPASHYSCGGIEVDKQGKTSITNLFACGECSKTGLHGANRLASNSLLEALVYAHNIFEYLKEEKLERPKIQLPEWNYLHKTDAIDFQRVEDLTYYLQKLMLQNVGVERTNKDLFLVKKKIEKLFMEVEQMYKTTKINIPLCELRNMLSTAYLIVENSILQKENRGCFFKKDNCLNFNDFVF